MHKVFVKSILSPNNGMNLYRGCSHGCIYCDSRSICYHIDKFEDIEVKENALELLEVSLKKKRNRCMIGTGSMTDPYIPLEKELKHVRKALELIYKYGFGATLITKSNLVLRDLDLLKKINDETKCVVQMTLTTFDEELCKKLEPNVCTTKERFEALKKLNEEKIPTIVWLSPILPFINDTMENLDGILNYCIEAKVKGILCFGMGLTLREGNREYFYKNLDILFPGLSRKYIQKYHEQYSIASDNNNELMKHFREVCKKNNIMYNTNEIFIYLNTFEERNLFNVYDA